jgi:hypothetical protein
LIGRILTPKLQSSLRGGDDLAIQANPTGSQLVIRVETGVNAQGAKTYSNRSYDLKNEATDEDVFAVAQALASLQSRIVASVQRIHTFELEEN